MNLLRTLSAFAAVAVLVGGSAFAQEACTKCPHATAGKACAACPSTTVAVQDGEKGCPIAAAMEHLPTISYKVGDEVTCCNQSAAALAKKHEVPVQYVVAEKSYDSEAAAYDALVETTETFVTEFVTPSKCDVSGKHSIAGHSCDCPVEAGKHAELVHAAVEKVHMSYVIGDHKCNCPNEAATYAKEHSQEVHYVVGDVDTTCEKSARINLAHAKYKAAVQAVVAATQPQKKDS